jgi:hypothetical protein
MVLYIYSPHTPTGCGQAQLSDRSVVTTINICVDTATNRLERAMVKYDRGKIINIIRGDVEGTSFRSLEYYSLHFIYSGIYLYNRYSSRDAADG